MGVTNGSTSKVLYVSHLPVPHLPPNASQANSFGNFPHSLMSDDKTCDDSTIAIFSQEGVTTIHREHDVLLTCKDEPKLIGVLDNHGGYCISLVQNKGHLQTRLPSKKALHALQQANSVCITSLPLSKPSHGCMLSVVTPSSPHDSKRNRLGTLWVGPCCLSRTSRSTTPKPPKSPKGYLNQTRKNVSSTKPKAVQFEEFQSLHLRGDAKCGTSTPLSMMYVT